MYASRRKMKAAAMKYGGVLERVGAPMTRAKALRLKDLAEEACQPGRYAKNLSFEEGRTPR
jgi:hypothetical protein